jgi:hypothetical protein
MFIKLRKRRWTGHVTRMEQMRNAYKNLTENLKGRGHLEDLDADGWIILEEILGNGVRRCGLDESGLGYGQLVGSCEHGNELWGSIKFGEFD